MCVCVCDLSWIYRLDYLPKLSYRQAPDSLLVIIIFIIINMLFVLVVSMTIMSKTKTSKSTFNWKVSLLGDERKLF